MSNPNFPGRQSLLKINRYSLMMRPAAAASPSTSASRAAPSDPSLPLRGRPSKRVKMEYMSAAIRHQHSSTFIMKLFDRSVDLARFPEATPLYPVCRAWMQNAPRVARRDEVVEGVPEPRELQADVLERYNRKELDQIEKMPGPAESELEPFVREERFAERGEEMGTGEEESLGREELLKGHKERWSGIKRRWVGHRRKYLGKYQQSFDLLDAIMMKQA
ncbi:protein lin-37 homolog [Culex quinquefasciatus]|uniref:protein lin-37 homolog n=1 Tax=Culex quinquefasciatus TaxID=7176 RepID=UPI0018E39AB6|nr:protein lin-37 homolog [Culex quinquefasciatus]